MLVISLFIPLNMAPAGAENTREKYRAFKNSFFPKVIRRLEQIKNRIGTKCLFLQIKHKHKHAHAHV